MVNSSMNEKLKVPKLAGLPLWYLNLNLSRLILSAGG
jgi:hypothetical protein